MPAPFTSSQCARVPDVVSLYVTITLKILLSCRQDVSQWSVERLCRLTLEYFVLQCFAVLVGPTIQCLAMCLATALYAGSLKDPSLPASALCSQRKSTSPTTSVSFQFAFPSSCNIEATKRDTKWVPRVAKATAEFKSHHCSRRGFISSIAVIINGRSHGNSNSTLTVYFSKTLGVSWCAKIFAHAEHPNWLLFSMEVEIGCFN